MHLAHDASLLSRLCPLAAGYQQQEGTDAGTGLKLALAEALALSRKGLGR